MAAAFALEAFLPEERGVYLAHVGGCGLCRQLVGPFQTVADVLHDALPEEPASPALKERILTQTRTEMRTEGEPRRAPSMEERETQAGWRWPVWMTGRPLGVMAVLVLVVVGIVAWNISLQLRLVDQIDLTAGQRDLIEAVEAGARVSQFSGTEAAPEASGTLVRAPERGKALLLVQNMPPLPANREYHVWRITGDVLSNVGSFVLTDDRDQLVTLMVEFSDADALGVSVEAAGSSPDAPTGAIVFLRPL